MKFIPTAVMLLMLLSCNSTATTSLTKYNIVGSEVDKPAIVSKFVLNTDSTKQGNTITYKDDYISSVFLPTRTGIEFILNNNSNGSIKVHWDNGAFVDLLGESKRIIHTGTKFSEKNKQQLPTVIAKGTKISESVVPSENIFYGFNSWEKLPILPNHLSEKEALAYKGRTFKLFLPIEIEGEIQDYIFVFKIENIVASKTPSKTKVNNVATGVFDNDEDYD